MVGSRTVALVASAFPVAVVVVTFFVTLAVSNGSERPLAVVVRQQLGETEETCDRGAGLLTSKTTPWCNADAQFGSAQAAYAVCIGGGLSTWFSAIALAFFTRLPHETSSDFRENLVIHSSVPMLAVTWSLASFLGYAPGLNVFGFLLSPIEAWTLTASSAAVVAHIASLSGLSSRRITTLVSAWLAVFTVRMAVLFFVDGGASYRVQAAFSVVDVALRLTACAPSAVALFVGSRGTLEGLWDWVARLAGPDSLQAMWMANSGGSPEPGSTRPRRSLRASVKPTDAVSVSTESDTNIAGKPDHDQLAMLLPQRLAELLSSGLAFAGVEMRTLPWRDACDLFLRGSESSSAPAGVTFDTTATESGDLFGGAGFDSGSLKGSARSREGSESTGLSTNRSFLGHRWSRRVMKMYHVSLIIITVVHGVAWNIAGCVLAKALDSKAYGVVAMLSVTLIALCAVFALPMLQVVWHVGVTHLALTWLNIRNTDLARAKITAHRLTTRYIFHEVRTPLQSVSTSLHDIHAELETSTRALEQRPDAVHQQQLSSESDTTLGYPSSSNSERAEPDVQSTGNVKPSMHSFRPCRIPSRLHSLGEPLPYAQSLLPSIESALAGVRHISRLLSDVTTLHSLQTGQLDLELSRFHFSSVIGDMIRLVSPRAKEKGIEVYTAGGPGANLLERTVLADRDRMNQVLSNILNNAVDHANTSVQVCVQAVTVKSPVKESKATRKQRDARSISSKRQNPSMHGSTYAPSEGSAVKSADTSPASIAHTVDTFAGATPVPTGEPGLRVEVTDDGTGLTASEIKKLFRPYVQIEAGLFKPSRTSGLGLSICRAIIKRHGGRLGAYSKGRGKGSTFWFELPIASSSHPKLSPQPHSASGGGGTSDSSAASVTIPVHMESSERNVGLIYDSSLSHAGGRGESAPSSSEALPNMDSRPSRIPTLPRQQQAAYGTSDSESTEQGTVSQTRLATGSPMSRSQLGPHRSQEGSTQSDIQRHYVTVPRSVHSQVPVLPHRLQLERNASGPSTTARAQTPRQRVHLPPIPGPPSSAPNRIPTPSGLHCRVNGNDENTSQGSERSVSVSSLAPRAALGLTVMVVDDNATNRNGLARMLQRMGATVHVADDGVQVGPMCDELLPEGLHCIFMDGSMPIMGGIEATQRLRARGITVPVVAVTGNTEPRDHARFMRAGAMSVLQKPVMKADIAKALVNVRL